jgi:hypothetical protein
VSRSLRIGDGEPGWIGALLITWGRAGRAQTWHDPDHVERALDVSLGELQLDYGKSWAIFDVCGKAVADNGAVDLYLMHCSCCLRLRRARG